MSMPLDMNATVAASKSALEKNDLLVKKQALDQVRHNIAGGDEAAARRKDQKLKEACQGFEEIFLNKIWSQMRKSVPKESDLHSKEGEFYQQMFDKELVKKMSKSGGIGLGDMLYDHLKEASQRVAKTTSASMGGKPLPMSEQDRFRLAQQLKQEAPAQATPADATPAVAPNKAPGLAQIAYAPYADPSVDGGEVLSDAPAGIPLKQSGIRPVPTPTIDLQAPEATSFEETPAPGTPATTPSAQPAMAASATNAPVVKVAAAANDAPETPALLPPADTPEVAPAVTTTAIDPDQPYDASQPTPLDEAAMAQVASLGEEITKEAKATPENTASTPAAQKTAAQAYGAVEATTRQGGRRANMPPITDPVPGGELTSGFGWRTDPFTEKRAWHAGHDIAAKQGEPIGAAWDGEVVFAGESGEYGKIVVLEHQGGWRSVYGHAHEINVQNGQQVRAGEQIATVGQTGRATGPHLHFELRQGGLAWDPSQVKDHLLAKAASEEKSS